MIKEVAPDIFMVTLAEKNRFVKFSVNIFVIAGTDGLIFDSGYGKKRTSNFLADQIKKIENHVRDRGKACHITRVLPSHGHWDHFSGIEKLRKNLGVNVLVTKRMLKNISSKKNYRESFGNETKIIDVPLPFIKKLLFKVARWGIDEFSFRLFGIEFVKNPVELIEENSPLTVGNKTWEVIFLPGHCDDAIALYNRVDGILLGGDTLLRTVTTWLGPPKSDLEAYINSLEHLLSLTGLKLILPAHGSLITEPLKRINEAIDHRNKRTGEIFNTIDKAGETGVNFDAILKKYYPKLNYFKIYIARGWILSTLEYLMAKDMIYSSIHRNKRIFRVCESKKIRSE